MAANLPNLLDLLNDDLKNAACDHRHGSWFMVKAHAILHTSQRASNTSVSFPRVCATLYEEPNPSYAGQYEIESDKHGRPGTSALKNASISAPSTPQT
jgi:hypothetical protein